MNKACYRIIFNKSRGMLMAVSEIASSHGKNKGDSRKNNKHKFFSSNIDKNFSLGVVLLTAGLFPLNAFSQIVSDSAAIAANRATVLQAKNGVPVVNIQTPNTNGVSHNKYTQFDVLNNGVVLNNSRQGAASQLAGTVAGNPWLAKGEANVIINEVKSAAASKFEGNLEIAGKRADVVIANPAGIDIKGGGFINANRATLTTGTPTFASNGNLTGFTVKQGAINVNPNSANKGLGDNNNSANYTDLLARSVQVNANIHSAASLNVVTGANTISADLGDINKTAGSGVSPTVKLDVAALGGMYANDINLVGTESGLGVRNAGVILANHNLIVTADGRIENSGTVKTQANGAQKTGILSVSATNGQPDKTDGDITNTGIIESKNLLLVDAGRDLNLNKGKIIQSDTKNTAAVVISAGRHVTVSNAGQISNVGAGGSVILSTEGNTTLNTGGLLQSQGDISVDSGGDMQLDSNANISAVQNVELQAAGDAKLNNAYISSTQGSIHVKTAKPLKLTGNTATSSINVSGGSLGAAKTIAFVADKDITINTDIARATDIGASAGNNLTFTQNQQNFPAVTGDVYLKAGNLLNIDGSNSKNKLLKANDLTIEAGSVNTKNIELNAGHDLHITSTQGDLVFDRGSRLIATGNIEAANLNGNITATNLQTNAIQGHTSILGKGNVSLNTDVTVGRTQILGTTGVYLGSVEHGALFAQNGYILSQQGDVQLHAGNEINLGDNISISGKNIDVISQSGISGKNARVNATSGDVNFNAQGNISLDELNSTSTRNLVMSAHHDLMLSGGNLSANNNMAISSEGDLYINKISSGGIISTLKQIFSSSDATLKSNGILSVQSSGSQYMRNANLEAGAINIKSGSDLSLAGKTNWNAKGNTLLEKDAKLNALNGDLNIESGNNLNLLPSFNISSASDMTVQVKNTLTLTGISGVLGNPSAQVVNLLSGGSLMLTAGVMDIQAAVLKAKKDLNLTTTSGDMYIDGIKNTFASYSSAERVAQLTKQVKEIDADVVAVKASKEYRAMEELLKERNYWGERANSERDNTPVFMEMLHRLSIAQEKLKAYKYLNDKIALIEADKPDLQLALTMLNSKGKGYEQLGANISGNNINLVSNKGIDINGAKITATNKVSIQSAGVLPVDSTADTTAEKLAVGINISGLIDSFEYGKEGTNDYGYLIFNRPSEITGTNGVNIQAVGSNANSRLILNASTVNAANGPINLQALGDIRLESGQEELYKFNSYSYKTGHWYNRKTVTVTATNQNTDAAPVELNGKSINVKAGDNLDAYATEFNAPAGKINLTAANALRLYAVDEVSFNKVDTKKKSSFLGVTYNTSKTSSSRTVQSMLPSRLVAQSASTASGWDTLLQGTTFKTSLTGAHIQAGVGENARSDAKIILQGIKTTVTTANTRESNSVVWQKMSGEGSTTQTLTLPSFDGPTAPVLTAPGGYLIDIPAGELKTQIITMAKQPGFGYLNKLQLDKKTQWNEVKLAYDHWQYQQEGLTEAGSALVAIAVAVATNGTAVGLVTTGTSTAVMEGAVYNALITQASIALVNNKGDIGKTLKDLGSSSTVKSVVTAALSAGVANEVGANSLLNDLGKNQWQNKIITNVISDTGSSLVGAAINGGSLSDALVKGVLSGTVTTLHADIAGEIKGLEDDSNVTNYILHKVAHAAAGCAAAAAQKEACEAGAIGAGVGEIVAGLMPKPDNLLTMTPQEYAEYRSHVLGVSKLVAGTVAAYAGYDVGAATSAANTAVANNYLTASEAMKKAQLERKEKEGTLTADEKLELAGIRNLDRERDQTIRNVCTQGNLGGSNCAALTEWARNALSSFGEPYTYNLIYRDLYPADAANVSAILEGLDPDSVSRDSVITALVKATGKSRDEVASRYDTVMTMHKLTVTLAGFYGLKSLSEVEIDNVIKELRPQYVSKVNALASKAAEMRKAGASSEDIARALHAERRALGVEYKNLTPSDILDKIYARNIEKYGDKLGPSIDYLRRRGKSWDDIIESATRTGGKDLGL
jgi:filamentous hemagglutinin